MATHHPTTGDGLDAAESPAVTPSGNGSPGIYRTPEYASVGPQAEKTTTSEFLGTLLDDLAHNRVVLPVLPEAALKAQHAKLNPEANQAALAQCIAADAALSARIIRLANGTLFRGQPPVASTQTLIDRTATGRLHNLTNCLVMNLLWRQPASPLVSGQMNSLWSHATRVAALSEVIARKFTRLEPDQAMLAGLIHDVGALPILSHAAKVPEVVANRLAMHRIIERLHARVGGMVLRAWRFPDELLKVVTGHENLEYDSTAGPDLLDVVIIANLHSYIGTTAHRANINWDRIPAFGKLGLTPQTSITAILEARDEIAEMQQLLTS